jgi:hypothetical protein
MFFPYFMYGPLIDYRPIESINFAQINYARHHNRRGKIIRRYRHN